MSKVSVQMCVYNSAEWLKYALTSIYEFADEIVIGEAAWSLDVAKESIDDTIKIIKEFPDPENKIKLVRLGCFPDQRSARNEILKHQSGDWCMLVDSDEVWKKEHLDKLREYLDTTPLYLDNGTPNMVRFVPSVFNFYFDLYHGMYETNPRVYRLSKDQEFNIDQGKFTTQMIFKPNEIMYYHMSYCGEQTLKNKWWHFINDMPTLSQSRQHWQHWEANVFMEWNPEKPYIIPQNTRTMHPIGLNYILQRFKGEHPEILKSHPMWNKRWVKGGKLI